MLERSRFKKYASNRQIVDDMAIKPDGDFDDLQTGRELRTR